MLTEDQLVLMVPVYNPQAKARSATGRADAMVAAHEKWRKGGGVGNPDFFKDIAPLLLDNHG